MDDEDEVSKLSDIDATWEVLRLSGRLNCHNPLMPVELWREEVPL